MTTKHVTCILCPNGCELDVSYSGEPTAETLQVEGNLCLKGEGYALEELTHPKRTLTTSVLVRCGTQRQASVKTTVPIPREMLIRARAALHGLSIEAPIAIGDVIAANVAGTGANVVATRAVARREG